MKFKFCTQLLVLNVGIGRSIGSMSSRVTGQDRLLLLGQMSKVLLDERFVFRIIGQVFPFMWIFAKVIKFTGAIEVLDEAVAGAPY